MNYNQLPSFIDSMREKVRDGVSTYQTDAMIDIGIIIEAMNKGTLPSKAYWLTRDMGTELGWADKRMATNSIYGYVRNNENSILNGKSYERCFVMDFNDGTIKSIEAKELIEEVKKYGAPPKIVVSEKALSSSVVYLKGFEYAKEYNELEDYRRSNEFVCDCATDMRNIIKSNCKRTKYGLQFNSDLAMEKILYAGVWYHSDIIAFVAASTIVASVEDGRYDKDVKKWAEEIYTDLPKDVYEKAYQNGLGDSIHPIIINDFVHKVMNFCKPSFMKHDEVSEPAKDKKEIER